MPEKRKTFELQFLCKPCNQRAVILKVFFVSDGTLRMVGICPTCGVPQDFNNNVVQWMYAEIEAA